MTMELKRRWLAGVSGAIVLMAGPALAGTAPSAGNAEVNAKIDALEQQIQDLKASQAAQLTEEQRAASAPKNSFNLNNGRPTFTSADGNFSAALRALVQLDGGYYDQDKGKTPDLSSGSNFRRARIGLSGTVFKVWDYYFLYDFGGSGLEGTAISQAYVQYNGFGPQFAIRIGAFPPYANLEDSEGAADALFIERASATEITRGIAGGDGRTAVAVISQGDNYLASVAYTGGKAGTGGSFDEQQGAVGRFAFLPWNTSDSKLVVGINGSDVFDTDDSSTHGVATTFTGFANTPELRVDDNSAKLVAASIVNPKSLYHWGADAAANFDNFYAEGGYYGFGADSGAGSTVGWHDFDGWYASASWVLTGEAKKWDKGSASFRSPSAAHPVDGKGGWGAWEVAARYSTLDLNSHALHGGEQKIWTAGLNWYPNPALRVQFDYQHDDINSPTPSVNQNLNAVSVRLQVSL